MGIAEQQRIANLPAVMEAREIRDPRAATQQVRYMATTAPQIPEWEAENAIRQGYLANVIAYRCVQIIAHTIAALPFRAGPDPTKRTTFDTNAPLARKLGPPPGGPAPKLSGRKLIAWTIAQRLVTGRFAWELELDDNGMPLNFWPLCAANLKAFPTDSGSEWFRAFQYGRPDKPVKLTPEQVFYGWNPSQMDFREPESPLQASRYDLSIAVMGDRFSYGFLKNGAMPAAIVVTEAFPSKEQFERFKMNWRGNYQGPDNSGKVHFQEADPDRDATVPLSEAIYVQTLGVSQKDAQFLEQHKESLQMVAISLGVPWSKLDASGRTYDNAGHEDATFWESTILPLLSEFEDEINLDLAPRLGTELGWFDISEVGALKPARKFTTLDVNAAVLQGYIFPNEVRCDAGLEELPELDDWTPPVPMIPGLPAPATQTEAEGNAPPEPDAEGAFPEPAGGRSVGGTLLGTSTSTSTVKFTHTPTVQPRAALMPSGEVRRTSAWHASSSVIDTLESTWRISWSRFFAKQERSVISALRGKRGAKMFREMNDERDRFLTGIDLDRETWRKMMQKSFRESAPQIDPSSIFNRGYWIDQTAEHSTDLYSMTAAAGAGSVAAKFGVSFDISDPHAQDFITARSNQLAGQVTQTTYDQIQKVLSDAVDNGDSIDDIATAIRSVFDAASTARATTIARTETISAYNGSAQLQAATLDPSVVGGQEWISARDGRTREEHADADGQAISIGDSFDVGGESLAYPGDPGGSAENTVNCRCTLGFLTPDEMDQSEVERSVPVGVARAVLRMVNGPVDELSLRRALHQGAA